MQYETCRHVKEDGIYCGSPALRDRKYCYYHLMQRGRRLRRARALRDNQPYRLEIQSLDNLYAVRAALTDIAQALAAGQLDARTAGKFSMPSSRSPQPTAASSRWRPRSWQRGKTNNLMLMTTHASRNIPSLKNNSVSHPA